MPAGLFQRMRPPSKFQPLVPVTLLAIAAMLVVLAMLPDRWFEGPPEPPEPIAVDLLEPKRTSTARPTIGMSIGAGGFGTIATAPARRLAPSRQQPATVASTLTGAPAVPQQVSGLVRLLARVTPVVPSRARTLHTLAIPPRQFGRIMLRDGCLRLDEPGEPHVVLPSFARLYIDEDGFLTISAPANSAETNPRIGEPASWEGDDRRPLEAGAAARIRARCGPGAVRLVGHAQSVAAGQAAADGTAARNLVDMYGLPWASALAATRRCRVQLARNGGIDPLKMIETPCGSTPPRRVADPRSCPPGTRFRGGLCRTPEGHVRPVPAF